MTYKHYKISQIWAYKIVRLYTLNIWTYFRYYNSPKREII